MDVHSQGLRQQKKQYDNINVSNRYNSIFHITTLENCEQFRIKRLLPDTGSCTNTLLCSKARGSAENFNNVLQINTL